MIRWTVVRADEAPPLERGEAPPGLLAPEEARVLAGLGLLPRRRKWLLGRLAAKRLLAEVLAAQGRTLSFEALVVTNDAAGAPHALVDGAPFEGTISISHRPPFGLCALTPDPALRLGADLEVVTPRDPGLVRDFFTASEAARVAALGGRAREVAVARIWSAKEAVLKALGLGLRLDTRRIRVGEGEAAGDVPPGFAPLPVDLDPGLLPGGARAGAAWRDEGPYVVTLAWLR